MKKNEEAEQLAVSEPIVDAGSETQVAEQAERQVPLSALEAERQKRQERDEENRYLRELAMQQKAQLESFLQQKQPVQDDSDEDLVNKREFKQFQERFTKEELVKIKRDLSEEAFKDANPEAMRQIEMHLKQIIDRKPWLAQSIEQAPNRYSRAYEIVQDYAPAITAKQTKAEEAKLIVENSKKPGSPVSVGKPSNLSQGDYMKSLRGKKEWGEARRAIRGY